MRYPLLASLLLTSVFLPAATSAAAADIIVRFDDPDEHAKRAAAFESAVNALPIDPADGDQDCTDTNPVAARVDQFLNTVSGAWLKKDED